MSMKSRLERIQTRLEASKPEQLILAHYTEDELYIQSCSDFITGKQDKRVYNKVKGCKTPEELEEAIKGEKVNLILITVRENRV